MSEYDRDLEQEILSVARSEFFQKGYSGVSLGDIAKRVGCTQALIHYYYRSKDRLFMCVYMKNLDKLMAWVEGFRYRGDLVSDICKMLDFHFMLLRENPEAPYFALRELLSRKELSVYIREAVFENTLRRKLFSNFESALKYEIKIGRIRKVKALDLLIDIASLVIMTFATLPIYRELSGCDDTEMEKYINRRCEEIKRVVVSSLVKR